MRTQPCSRLHVSLNNLSSDQAYDISQRIFQKWQEIEENKFYNTIGRVTHIYQKNQMANLKHMMNKWLSHSKGLRIAELENEVRFLKEKLVQTEKQHVSKIDVLKLHKKHESERHSTHESEMVPPTLSPINQKARSVINILSSRNLRNKNKSNVKPLNAKSRLTLTEVDEDMVLEPPVAYNPFKEFIDSKSLTQKFDFTQDLTNDRKPPIYERLHEDAKMKEAKIREYELIKREEETNQ